MFTESTNFRGTQNLTKSDGQDRRQNSIPGTLQYGTIIRVRNLKNTDGQLTLGVDPDFNSP